MCFAFVCKIRRPDPLGLETESDRAVVAVIAQGGRIMSKLKPRQPEGQPNHFAARIWHWRAKKYIYASDYGLKGFPIRRGR